MLMKLSKLRKRTPRILFLYVSTDTGNWISYKLSNEVIRHRNTIWINAYDYELVLDSDAIL